MLLLPCSTMLDVPDNVSEASYVTSVEDASRVDQCTQTPSGKARPRTLQRLKVSVTDSPTISISPPHSLDYVCQKGSPGSVTPNGMLSSKSTATTVLLSPSYLQTTCQCSQSIKSVSEVALTMPAGSAAAAGAGWGEEVPGLASDGLSWRRLHMSRAKLKATATTSELLSGFAMVAMVELQINEPTNVPEWLFVMFAVCTTVLVAVHIFALMISTYLLPNIDAVSKMETPGGPTRALRDSPHERMRGFIELAWAFSTVLGLFLFLVEIAILCWVKFWDYSFAAATAATVIVIPVLIVFVAFAIHFYHSLVVQKCETSVQDIEQLETMKRELDTATVKVNMF
ncbi:PREDICTED: calcium release-activated calcium channel protein 1-like isoform X3 [Papilio polytes]|uniref:calcium release-activated calcium channel protein 1-like isoform X3 n=1 Tax=Papilio polytes TaxID=76194 RepID=UPI0006768FE7|nr:PREDICTED: calcium release-activated calcium channel protein 1-like isoform X3 [Papilio polytes]